MRNIIKPVCFTLAVLLAASCASNKKMSDSKNFVNPLSEMTAVQEGSLIYGLPLTVMDIEIEAERIIEKPGPYSRFAGDLLGLTDIIKTDNEFWKLKSINVGTHQELDPDEFYVIGTSTLFYTNVLALKESGLILDLNREIQNSSDLIENDRKTDLSSLKIYDLGADEYYQNRKDTLYKVVSVDTAFVKIPYLIEKKQKLTIDMLAEKAAVRLMELRDGKHLILTGETNVFPQNEAAINEINRLEKEYTELFTGKILKEVRTFSFHIIPVKDSAGKQTTICWFSESTGPGTTSMKSAIPVNMEFIPEMKTSHIREISSKETGSSGAKYNKLFYRIPEVVTIRVTFGNELINTSRKLIYQFGEVLRLPENYIIGK
jgi:hypothetical protein